MFQVGAACYPTAAIAASVSASDQQGQVVQRGSDAYVVSVQSATDTAIAYTFTPVGSGTALTVSAPYSAVPCGLLSAGDGVQMGWLVAAAWLGTYAIMFMSRALRGDDAPTIGS